MKYLSQLAPRSEYVRWMLLGFKLFQGNTPPWPVKCSKTPPTLRRVLTIPTRFHFSDRLTSAHIFHQTSEPNRWRLHGSPLFRVPFLNRECLRGRRDDRHGGKPRRGTISAEFNFESGAALRRQRPNGARLLHFHFLN